MRDEQDEFVVEAEIVEDAEIVVDAEIVEGAEIENAISSAPDVRSKKPDQLSNPTSIQSRLSVTTIQMSVMGRR